MKKGRKISIPLPLLILVIAIVLVLILNKATLTIINYNSNANEEMLTTTTADTTIPSLKSIEAEVVGTEDVTTGSIGDKILLTATFSEAVQHDEVPVLKIQFGDGEERTAVSKQSVSLSSGEEAYQYEYEIVNGDNGILSIASFTGTVYDEAGNDLKFDIEGTNCSGTTYSCTPVYCSGETIATCPECDGEQVIQNNIDCEECDAEGYVTCTTCDGTGTITSENTEECEYCSGTGKVTSYDNTTCANCTGGYIYSTSTCSTCSGYKYLYKCLNCGTYGVSSDSIPHTTDCDLQNIEYQACSGCGETGLVSCTTCNSSGTVTCTSCSGTKIVNCGMCGGDGLFGLELCSNCENTGTVTCTTCEGNSIVSCSICGGDGKVNCSGCDGYGGWYYCVLCMGTGINGDTVIHSGSCNGISSKKETCSTCNAQGTVTSSYSCSTCGGDGSITTSYKSDCSNCDGEGEVTENIEVACSTCAVCSRCGGNGYDPDGALCSNCSGNKCEYCDYTGRAEPCSLCDGSGLKETAGQTKCTHCDGLGEVTTNTDCSECSDGTITLSCGHDATGEHYYCEHYDDATNATHYYCEHNTNGITHDVEGILSENTVIADTEAPTITSITGNATNWTNQNVTLTINASDSAGGVLYSFDNGETWQTSNTKTYEQNTSEIIIKVKDMSGNVTTSPETININRIDKVGPTITGVTGNATNWTNQNVTLTINATDSQSGLASENAYSFDNGETWQTANTKTYTKNTSDIKIQVKDALGNVSAYNQTLKIDKIDKTAPTITINPNGATSSQSQNVTITVQDDGGSGLSDSNSYQYKLGTSNTQLPLGTWNNYTNGTEFTIGEGLTGEYYLWVKSVSDNAGNKLSGPEYRVSRKFTFDNTEEDVVISSDTYVIDEEGYIKNVLPNTSVADILQNLVCNYEIKVYDKNNNEITGTTLIGTGMKVVANNVEYVLVVKGDTDGNAKIDLNDAIKVLQHRAGGTHPQLTDAYLKAAQLTTEGEVTLNDVIKIMKYKATNGQEGF